MARSLSDLRRDLAARRAKAEAEVRHQLETLRKTSGDVESGLSSSSTSVVSELVATQNDIEGVSHRVHHEVHEFQLQSENWNRTVQQLDETLKQFGDLETFFEQTSAQLQEIASRIKIPRENAS